MADYPPPTDILPEFNPAVFRTNDIPLTIAEAENYFLSFPTAQGTENLTNVNVAGILTSTRDAHNLGFGYQALSSAVDGSAIDNTAFGYQALKALTIGDSNSAFGDFALKNLGTASTNKRNTALGHQAGISITAGADNTLVGFNAGAGTTSTADYNTAVGSNAGSLITTGSNNTLVGSYAGSSIQSSNLCVFVGDSAGLNMVSSNYSTGVGYGSLLNATGIGNTALGALTGTGIISGTYNTFVGYDAGSSSSSITSSTAIGNGARVSASNQIVLGTATETVRYQKVAPLYSALPTYASTDIGYTESISFSLNTTNNTQQGLSASLPVGVWHIYSTLALGGTFGASEGSILVKTGYTSGTPASGTVRAVFPLTKTTGTYAGVCVGSFIFSGTPAVVGLVSNWTATTLSAVGGFGFFYATRIA